MNKDKKNGAAADINVVSDLPLEAMLRQLETLADKNTQVTIQPLDADSARFRLVYLRDGRGTASVSGQVRRWADTLSHVVCEGDAIRERRRWSRWLLVLMALPVSLPLIAIASGNFVFGLMGVLMYIGLALGTLTLVALVELWRRMDWNRVPEQRFAAHQTGIPHYKDRERLLQKIVLCVKPSEVPGRLIETDTAQVPATERAAQRRNQ